MIYSEKPYEKFKACGADSLSNAELLAIILRTGTKNKDALALATEVLQHFAGEKAAGEDSELLGLYEMKLDKLKKIRGIGEVKAVKLLCITELSKRISMAKKRENLTFRDPKSVADYFMEYLRHRETECVVLVCLDGKGSMVSHSVMTSGSVRQSLLSPREIFLEALEKKAVNILLLHNHPSGDPTPSQNDMEITENIRQVGNLIDIPLLDHIIIGDHTYYSFLQHGRL